MARARNWVFTLNNWTEEERAKLDSFGCSYMVYGREIAPTTGTPHLQGYLELENAKSASAIKKKTSNRLCIFTRKGTAAEASTYCKKEDKDFVERGTISKQGERNDLHVVADLVKEGGVKLVVEERPDMFIKFGRNIERLAELLMTERTKKPEVTWLWGATGTYKTWTATHDCDDYYMYNQTKWWNGYRQQKRIVIDDYSFDGTDGSFRYLLKLLDHYKVNVETKGGMIPINSPEIVITCEFHPDQIFIKSENELAQVVRRIDNIINMNEYVHNPVIVFEDEIMKDAHLYGDDGFPLKDGIHPDDNIVD